MLLFCLEDQLTGEIRNMAAPEGTTEAMVRSWYGGIWLDPERTHCPPPCHLGRRSPRRETERHALARTDLPRPAWQPGRDVACMLR